MRKIMHPAFAHETTMLIQQFPAIPQILQPIGVPMSSVQTIAWLHHCKPLVFHVSNSNELPVGPPAMRLANENCQNPWPSFRKEKPAQNLAGPSQSLEKAEGRKKDVCQK